MTKAARAAAQQKMKRDTVNKAEAAAAAATKKHANHLFRKLKHQSKKVKHSVKALHAKAKHHANHLFKNLKKQTKKQHRAVKRVPKHHHRFHSARAAAQAKMKKETVDKAEAAAEAASKGKHH